MNALAVELVAVAKEYLGPAAPAFLQREMTALGVNANNVTQAHVLALAERTRLSAAKVMDPKKAGDLATALAQRGGRVMQPKVAGDHRLASDAAAKLFVAGRLRQAETAYRELVQKHGDVDAYSGLARTLVSLEDRNAALVVLRDGAAAMAKRNDRIGAIALLGVAVELAPADLNAHRRLAAALANQGDLLSACAEYARYIDVVLAQRDTRRAWLELTYGRETLGDLPQLLQIADRVAAAQSGAMPTPPPSSRVAATPSTTSPTPPPARPATIKPSPLPTPPVRPTLIGASEVGAKPAPASALSAAVQARTRPAALNAFVIKNAQTITHIEKSDMATPAELLLARAGLNGPAKAEPERKRDVVRPPIDVEAALATLQPRGDALEQAMIADGRANVLIAARDARAAEAALDAARKLIALHKLQAASDVLLDLIAAGFKDREAHRLLIEVDCEIGAREVAREKCQLLGAVYRLDGHGAIAEDVERLAMIL
jgi:hypothetical protein